MKKILLIFTLAFMTLASYGQSIPRAELFAIVNKYRVYEEVDVMKVGTLGTAALKNLIFTSMASEGLGGDARAVMDLIRGVKKMAIMDYEGCSSKMRARITGEIEDALRGCEMLMEAKDEDSAMRIYGVVADNSNKVSDFVLFAPNDCSLICLFGSISLDAIMRYTNQ